MNKQLLAIKRLMEKTGVAWWIDSGTLLGLVRSGDVLPWDNDIDIGIWKKDNPSVAKTLSAQAAKEDHSHRVLTMRGDPVMHLLNPLPGKEGLRATIMVYRPSPDGTRALCPGYHLRPNPHPPKTARWLLKGSYRTPVRIAARWLRKHGSERSILVDRWPFRLIHQEIEFDIPIAFFQDLADVHGFPAPSPPEDYLAYRYGDDWQVPKPRTVQYVWHRDDGAVRQRNG